MTLRASLLALLVLCLCAAPAGAATFDVNSPADELDASPGDGQCATAGAECTLRAAIMEANANPSEPDTIRVPPETYTITRGWDTGPDEQEGDFDVLGPTTIIGTGGARQTIVDAAEIDRVFEIGNATVTITGLTIRGGSNLSDASGGGGIRNAGTLTLESSAVIDNLPEASGGGISNAGSLEVVGSLIANNSGGSGGVGGGIHNAGGTATISNSTISGNSGEEGAALQDEGVRGTSSAVTIEYSTIADNANLSPSNAAIGTTAPVPPTVRDSIVAGNSPANCGAPLITQGHNIDSEDTCGFTAASDRRNTDPQLGALVDNGGPTSTRALAATSPAVDSAASDGCPATDQRGFPRVSGPGCDIGAFERQQPAPPPPPVPAQPAFLDLTPARARRRPGADNVVTASVRNSDGSPGAGRTVRYAIAGPNDGAGSATTDAAGIARISWDGVREGTDVVSAYVDTDGDSIHDAPAEPSRQATVTWALPAPLQGRTVNIEPISGIVRIRVPRRRSGGRGPRPRTRRLTEARQIPLRAIVDTRRGRVQMTSVNGRRPKLERGVFHGGVFTTRQASRGGSFTELRLIERLRCSRGRDGVLQPARARSRRLWGRVRRRGRFRTRGRYSTAAVRGTVWLQKDSCASTTTVVREGVVLVRDFARRKTVRVKAGRRYTARADRRR